MFKIKRLYSFILQSFLPVFLMTFGICLFIVLMQFLWKYVEDIVGKGISINILLEMFLYAGLSFIPLALPLAILLAALMTFGNMGERLELLAIKAAGISLLKTMKPLIFFIAIVSIGAFFFQNEAMPRIQVKFRTLLVSVKEKSPELDIPEGAFYNGIRGYSIHVKKKNPKTRMMYDVMIYDTSKGLNDMMVFVCDSALMTVADTKDRLYLDLFSGQRFSRDDTSKGNQPSRRNSQYAPYSRENFKKKAITIYFSTDFNMIDESSMEGTQFSKDLKELTTSIDSMRRDLDSLNRIDREMMFKLYRPEIIAALQPSTIKKETNISSSTTAISTDTVKAKAKQAEESQFIATDLTHVQPINFDSLTNVLSRSDKITSLERVKMREEGVATSFYTQSWMKPRLEDNIRRHEVEMHRKFTLSFACLIFFFIGAPLGAIIRKGGMGVPVIISVAFFIVYYIFENVGVKMARDGVWPIWQGTWLSSMILFPIGVFLTYKSMNDSDLFNIGAYSKYIRKILFMKPKPVSFEEAEVDPKDIKPLSELNADPDLVNSLLPLDSNILKDIIMNYQQYKYDQSIQPIALAILKERGENFFGIKLKNPNYKEAKKTYKDFTTSGLIGFIPLIGCILADHTVFFYPFLVLYLIFLIRTCFFYFDFYRLVYRHYKPNSKHLLLIILYYIIGLYCVILYPLSSLFLRKSMKKDMGNVI
ncbi:LptF/LptG family permease [Dysgonomonas sp. 25]|uniref:LptF/LptG family permease n=1 Tax=Dysgonomonas sp. 25 TaxID=2302933 RepID=UPI001C86DA77|nr:LptF/LptG family permease [Dysgonomonas sp. 25]NDV68425.1 YjgP/YjgQ family permease [Dysgonomonas sp. 25]